jgi:hypothetical protein
MAVRCCARHYLGGYIAICSRPVLDDELLAEPLRKPLPHQAPDEVGRGARRIADDPWNGLERK